MNISCVQSSQKVYADTLSKRNSTQSTDLSFSNNTEPYTVNISEEGNKLSKMSSDVLPYQAYAYPKWSNNWFSDLSTINLDGGLASVDYQSKRYNSLDQKTKNELGEYHHSIQKFINEELINHGIDNRSDYYYKFLQDDKLSEEVHQAVIKRIADDPRVMELMESFGLPLY